MHLRHGRASLTFVFAVAASAGIVAAPADAGTTGSLGGVVTIAGSREPLGDATVTIESPAERTTARTDRRGSFAFVSLPPDSYTLTVAKDGYDTVVRRNLVVQADQGQTVTLAAPKLREIGRVVARSGGGLVRPGTVADVYSLRPAQQRAAALLGGGTDRDSAYSAIASVPGTYVPTGQTGRTQSVYIRGGDFSQTGNEIDGIPINRAFDRSAVSGLSNLGNQEVQVYTGAAPIDAQAQGLAGFVNQVIRTGTSPGFTDLSLAFGGPAEYRKISLETGGATKNRNFTYYLGYRAFAQSTRLIDQFGGTRYTPSYGALYNYAAVGCGTPNPSVGCYANGLAAGGGPSSLIGELPIGPNGYAFAPTYFAFVPQIDDRSGIANLHFALPHKRDGLKDDVQFLEDFGSTKDTRNGSLAAFGSALEDVRAGTITRPDGSVLPNGAGTCPQAVADVACAGPVAPRYLDRNAYVGPLNAPLRPGDVNAVRSSLAPGSPPNRALGAAVPPDRSDGTTSDFSLQKLQYQHDFSTRAFARVYGYRLSSNERQDGTVGFYQDFVGSFVPDYRIASQTLGTALTLGDQIDAHHLLTLNAAYSASHTTRVNDQSFALGSSVPIAYLVDANAPTAGCYGVAGGAPARVACGSADRYTLPALGGTSLVASNPAVTAATAGGLRCGTGPCTFFATDSGAAGPLNAVRPAFTDVSLRDQIRVNDRLDLDLGLRYDSYFYKTADTSSPGNRLLVDDFNASTCIGGTTLVARAYGADCPAGSAPAALTAQSPNVGAQVWEPRLGATYKLGPDDVLRFSYGRYAQAPPSVDVQSASLQSATPSSDFYTNFGFTGFSRSLQPEISYNADFSLEHRFAHTDVSAALTPFLRKTQNEFVNVLIDPKTNFVAEVNGENRNVSGVELAIDKGDFERDGWSGRLAYTYTHATARYRQFASGGLLVAGANTAIANFNAYTGFCAKTPGSPLCGKTVSGAAAAPCYTIGGAASPDCGAGTVANPYWNARPGALLDPNAAYAPYNQALGTGNGGVGSTSNVVPHVATLVVNYKHKRFSITPSLQFQAGARYGSPLATQGVAPDTCGAALAGAVAPTDPRYIYGLPSGGGLASGYDASSCKTPIVTPDPYTKRFDGIGEFTQPSSLSMNLELAYRASRTATIRLSAANLVNTCFGGSGVAWGVPGLGCSYLQGASVGNFYNPGDPIQSAVHYPYQPAVAGSTQSVNATSAQPFRFFLGADFKF